MYIAYILKCLGAKAVFQTWFYIFSLGIFFIHLIYACCIMRLIRFSFSFRPLCHQGETRGFLIILASLQLVYLLNLPKRWQNSELRLQPDLV